MNGYIYLSYIYDSLSTWIPDDGGDFFLQNIEVLFHSDAYDYPEWFYCTRYFVHTSDFYKEIIIFSHPFMYGIFIYICL
jgi:hypothetical protein